MGSGGTGRFDHAYLTVDVSNRGVVALRGELDAGSAHLLVEAMAIVPRVDGGVILDVGDLSFIDVSGVRALAEVASCEPMVRFVVRSPQPEVKRFCGLLMNLFPPNVRFDPVR